MPNLNQLESQVEIELKELGLDLVEFKTFQSGTSKTLRITVNDPKTHVGHEQCAKASKAIRKLFEDNDHNYNLEVWSPGVGRELKAEKDFRIFKGKLIEIVFADPEAENKIGILQEKVNGHLKLLVNDSLEEISEELIKKVVLALDSKEASDEEKDLVEISMEDI